MSQTFKIILVLLVIASVVSAGLAVFAFISKEREYVKRILLEDKLAVTLKDKSRLEKEIDSGKKAKEENEAKIKEMKGKVEKLLSQIEEEKNNSKAAAKEVVLKKEKIDALKKELEKERKEKLSISKKLDDLEFDYQKVKAGETKLKAEKTRLEKKLSDLRENPVNLDTIVVNPLEEKTSLMEPTVADKELLKGRVLVVNKEYGFVVADIGLEDGIENGMMFEVRGGNVLLGKAEINKVYDTMSSASILPGGKVNNMKKGDLFIESR